MVGNSNLPIAIVVGLEENGLGVTRPLARNNIPCIGFATPGWNPAYRTNSCRVIHASAWTKEAFVSDLIRLATTLDAKSPLLITKDEPVLWISEHREELSRYYEINLPDPEIVRLLMDKQRFTRLAVSRGWPVPETHFINSPEELRAQVEEIVFPCILKPAVRTSTFRQHSATKAWKVSNQDELLCAYETVARWEKEVVVQEWIEGGDERVTYCLAYYDRKGQPLALFAGRKLRQWPLGCGNTVIAEPAPKAWAGSILELSDSIFRAVNYRGLGSIEFKMRAGSDQPVITEPTVGRTDYQSEVAVFNGQDIPTICYYDLIGSGYYPACCGRKPVKLIDGSAERRAAWKLYRSGRLSLGRWLSDWRGRKRYMRFRLNDPGPGLDLAYRELRGMAGRMVRYLLGRG
ncbi:MAG: hypothetical protein JSV52_12635 [Candidatus Zixiibacteriota bacterium]|nr:MAG: hypothetical protein JSV52_12635 [candidate division Zixibacteria bacterium]